MTIDNLSAANAAHIQNKPAEKAPEQVPAAIENTNEQHDYKKYLKIAGIATAALAIGGGIIYFAKKGKVPEISDVIDFTKDGIAYVKKGSDAAQDAAQELFTGKVKKTLKDGGEIILEYKDGLVQKSTKAGKDGFEKVFNYETIGDENILTTVQKTVNGKTENIDILQLQQEGANKALLIKTQKEAEKLAKEQFEEGFKYGSEDFVPKNIKEQNRIEELMADANAESLAAKKAGYTEADLLTGYEVEKIQAKKLAKQQAAQEAAEKQAQRAKEQAQKEADSLLRSSNYRDRLKAIKQNNRNLVSYGEPSKARINALKKANPEIIKALSDEQIERLLTHSAKNGDTKKVLDMIEKNYTPEQIRKISTCSYSTVFIQNMFDVLGCDAQEANKVINWYSKIK